MRFEDAYEGWTEKRLTLQIPADRHRCHYINRPRQLDGLRDAQAPRRLRRRRFYAKEGGRPGWPVQRERPSNVKET